jgi:CH-like domain in sperm protein
VAELLSRFFPKDLNMQAFSNGKSARCKADNWAQVQRACKRNAFMLPAATVDAVEQEQPGAAVALLELLYEHLTQKKLLRPENVRASDVTVQYVCCWMQLGAADCRAINKGVSISCV